MIVAFSDIMHEWKRMCDVMNEKYNDKCCEYCPLHDLNCGAIWEVDENADWNLIEKRITQWSHENPPKIYPTIYHILINVFGLPQYEKNIKDWVCENRISENLAKKLNIDPIED